MNTKIHILTTLYTVKYNKVTIAIEAIGVV